MSFRSRPVVVFLVVGAWLSFISVLGVPKAVADAQSIEPEQWMEISTNSAIRIEVRLSHANSYGEDDIDCRKPFATKFVRASTGIPVRIPFNFSRQLNTGVALYRWNVCFVFNHTTYRAWRGFDPGPGAILHASCSVDVSKPTEQNGVNRYLCPNIVVKPNPDNYNSHKVSELSTLADDGMKDFAPRERIDQFMSVRSGLSRKANVYLRMSRVSGDVDCVKGSRVRRFGVEDFVLEPLSDTRIPFLFSEEYHPSTAIHEWNICFDIDGTRYRVWQGFDPGPRGVLQASCTIDERRLAERDASHYLCSDTQARFDTSDYGQFAAYCLTEDVDSCRWFSNEAEYDQWVKLGNPVTHAAADELALAALVAALRSPNSYLAKNRASSIYLSIRGRDPSPWLRKELRRLGISYRPDSGGWITKNGTRVPRGMMVSISSFEIVSPNKAVGSLDAYCGTVCGGQSRVTLHHGDDGWVVDDISLTTVE